MPINAAISVQARLRRTAAHFAAYSAASLSAIVLTVAVLVAGCAAYRPTYMPPPIESIQLDGGGVELAYDTDDDGTPDYYEQINAKGRVERLRIEGDHAGEVDLPVPSAASASASAPASSAPGAASQPDRLRLLIILDSVPFAMVAEAHDRGLFPYFFPPVKAISTYPVMTDLALNEFFGESPAIAVETDYYDGKRSIDGWAPYFAEANSKWLRRIDYHRPFDEHGDAYTNPRAGFERELYDIERLVKRRRSGVVNAYMVSPSALGFLLGRDGHAWELERLDRFCRALFRYFRGDIDITLMSDHGHQFALARRAAIVSDLRRFGYRVTGRLQRAGDVVTPGYGLVSTASMYTRQPERVATDMARLDYVELAAFRRKNGAVCVVSGDQRAVIQRHGDRFRYAPESGDPLELSAAIQKLMAAGKVDREGFASDEDWFAATCDHVYPDPLYRLYRATHGLVEFPPDVLISLRKGWCYGSPFMSMMIAPRATHGSLNADSTNGFAMTTVGPLTGEVRMEDLAAVLQQAGWPAINPPDQDEQARADWETARRSGTGQTEYSGQ